MDTIQKLRYRANAGIADAAEKLNNRLADRQELPLNGIHGEKLYLTGLHFLRQICVQLDRLYDLLPEHRGVTDSVLLDAFASATIEGARTTVENVKKSFSAPKTKDDRMVVNTVAASNFAYTQPITGDNIRRLWEIITDGVCDNEEHRGTLYRDSMVYIGSSDRIIHTPAAPEQLPESMDALFAFLQTDFLPPLLRSFVAHFYFVYLHPFCDGNGRTARVMNASQLYHAGYHKIKGIPLSGAINRQLSGYYNGLSDSEIVLVNGNEKWLDLTPFVGYMLSVFESSLIDASLSKNTLTEQESRLLQRMNKAGTNAEITAKKAAGILELSETDAEDVLDTLVQKGYLIKDTSHTYQLNQHIIE